MKRLEALKELAAIIKNGGTPEAWQVVAAFGGEPQETAFVPLVRWACDPDDISAMGAAKALHKAVLPGWVIYRSQWWPTARSPAIYELWQTSESRDGSWNHSYPRDMRVEGASDDPARAWLLAILRALIAMEEANETA